MPALAKRLNEFQVSASVQMTMMGRELAAKGVKVISLASGEPDFPTPPHAIEAAYRAAREGDTKYPPQDGTRALKEAVQRKFKRDNNLDYALDRSEEHTSELQSRQYLVCRLLLEKKN